MAKKTVKKTAKKKAVKKTAKKKAAKKTAKKKTVIQIQLVGSSEVFRSLQAWERDEGIETGIDESLPFEE